MTKSSKTLGLAFLFQFVTSLSAGVILKSAWFVPEDMGQTLMNIAGNPTLFRVHILFDMLTVVGVLFLGVVLYLQLRKLNEYMALTALGLYFLEVVFMGVSKIDAFSLLRISQEYVASGMPQSLLSLGTIAYWSMDFGGNTLHMLAFCFGAILFYSLLYKSGIVPRWLSLWGLVTVFPMLIGTVVQVLGYSIPFAFYLPYVPFELVIGIWILVKGIRDPQPPV